MTNDANNCVALSELSSSVVSQEYKTGEWVKWLQISTHAQTLTQSCRGDQSVIKEISNQSRAADVPIATRDTCSSYSSMHTVYLCIHPRAVDRYGHIFLCVCVSYGHYTTLLICCFYSARFRTSTGPFHSEAALWLLERLMARAEHESCTFHMWL